MSIENIIGMMFEYFGQYPNILSDLRQLQVFVILKFNTQVVQEVYYNKGHIWR
ncbi:hypothetical protein AGMMS49990_03540 [Endomicrobiia bacterium]|nr:hypothetical protein AGMMS49990_03540 [Endomicrobiia bacterium]